MSGTYDREVEAAMLRRSFPEMTDSERTGQILAGALRSRLTPKQRQTLLLHYVRGMSVSQIARLRGVYPSTVWRTLHRARKELFWAMRLGGVDIRE